MKNKIVGKDFNQPLWEKIKVSVVNTVLFAFSAICLIYPAIINGYPLVYPDSGTYIMAGFSCTVPVDKPIMYAFFLRHISLYETLWLVIVMQAIVVTTTIQILFKCFFEQSRYFLYTAISIFSLSILTGISFYVSQLMPDIFSAVLLISLGLLISIQKMNKARKVLLSILIVFSNMAHTSNLMTSSLLVLLLIVCFIFFKRYFTISLSKLLLVFSLVLASWLMVSTTNYLCGASFKITRAPNIFLMGRLVDSGVLNDYLTDKCTNDNIPLCKYVNKLPANASLFWWDKDSPLYEGGCFKEEHIEDCWIPKSAEYDPIVKEILTTPKYLSKYISFASIETLKLLKNFQIVALPVMMEGSPVKGVVGWRFKKDMKQYVSSEQSKKPFEMPLLNSVQNISIAISFLLICVLFLIKSIYNSMNSEVKKYSFIIISCVLINAIVCSTFSAGEPRYQGRVVWLIPLLLLLIFISIIKSKRINRIN